MTDLGGKGKRRGIKGLFHFLIGSLKDWWVVMRQPVGKRFRRVFGKVGARKFYVSELRSPKLVLRVSKADFNDFGTNVLSRNAKW